MTTEKRAVLHTALRNKSRAMLFSWTDKNVMPEVEEVTTSLEKMKAFFLKR